MALSSWLDKAGRALDRFQQRHPVLAFPVAMWRELDEQKWGQIAALLTYYALISLFPLLLLLTTVLGTVLRHNPALQNRVLNSALVDFPVIGNELKSNIHGFGRSGLALAVGIVGTALGSLSLAHFAQDAMNRLWRVPQERWPGFPRSWLRSLGLIATMGLGVLSTTILSSLGELGTRTVFGLGARIALLVASFAATTMLFWMGLRIATAPEVHARDLRLSAVLAAVVWQGLQYVGGFIAARQLAHSSSLYGTFGLVLGLIAWIYLQARLTLIAVAADVVRAKKTWPRSLFPQ